MFDNCLVDSRTIHGTFLCGDLDEGPCWMTQDANAYSSSISLGNNFIDSSPYVPGGPVTLPLKEEGVKYNMKIDTLTDPMTSRQFRIFPGIITYAPIYVPISR